MKYIIALILCLSLCIASFSIGIIMGKNIMKYRGRIKNSSLQRLPYDEFMKEQNITPPITGIWVENNLLYVATDKNGIFDIRPLEIKYD